MYRRSWGLEEHLYRHSNCNSGMELKYETEVFEHIRSQSNIVQVKHERVQTCNPHPLVLALLVWLLLVSISNVIKERQRTEIGSFLIEY